LVPAERRTSTWRLGKRRSSAKGDIRLVTLFSVICERDLLLTVHIALQTLSDFR